MRREDRVRQAAQRRVFGQRLAGVHVEHGAAELSRLQSGDERLFVDDAAPRHVDDDRAALERPDLAPADESARLVGERRVDRDDVGVGHVLDRRDPPHLKGREPLVADVRIVGDERHAEGVGATGDLAADPAEPDDAERLPLELLAGELRPVPLAFAHRHDRVGQVAQQAEDIAEEQLGDGDGIARRRIDHGDAESRRRFHVDVVDADAGPADDAQPSAAFQQLGGDLRRAPTDQRVIVPDALEQLLRRQSRNDVDRERPLFGEERDAFGVDLVGYENAMHDNRRAAPVVRDLERLRSPLHAVGTQHQQTVLDPPLALLPISRLAID